MSCRFCGAPVIGAKDPQCTICRRCYDNGRHVYEEHEPIIDAIEEIPGTFADVQFQGGGGWRIDVDHPDGWLAVLTEGIVEDDGGLTAECFTPPAGGLFYIGFYRSTLDFLKCGDIGFPEAEGPMAEAHASGPVGVREALRELIERTAEARSAGPKPLGSVESYAEWERLMDEQLAAQGGR